MAEEHLEETNYFASMTDLLVGFLFVFVIMLAYFAFQIQQQNAKYTELDKYISNAQEARDSLVRDVVKELNENNVEAKIGRSNNVITISGESLFQSASSVVDSRLGADKKLDEISRILLSHLKCHAFRNGEPPATTVLEDCNPSRMFVEAVFVEGHTDNVRINGVLADGSRTNLELSAHRATNAYQRMVLTHEDLTALKNPSGEQALSVAAYGEQRPVASNHTSRGRSDNRRIDILIDMHAPKSVRELQDLLKRINN